MAREPEDPWPGDPQARGSLAKRSLARGLAGDPLAPWPSLAPPGPPISKISQNGPIDFRNDANIFVGICPARVLDTGELRRLLE